MRKAGVTGDRVTTATRAADADSHVLAERLIAARLTEDGTPVGNFNATGDYSVTPQNFFIQIPPTHVWYISAISVFIQGAGNLRVDQYGPIPALTNGVTLNLLDEVAAPILPPITVKQWSEFEEIPGLTVTTVAQGAGDNALTGTWEFRRAAGQPLTLTAGQSVNVLCSDDFTALTKHTFTVTGYYLVD